ncbi:MAG TPA: carbonic anhydrase [Fermentimonas caenicola]|jgi:carbonic anhydrase|uniref:Carbonic anhydrase n=1 Tax=Fermentimonas caenicola TaxID=1562970 RepID=A0A098BVU4_9BACT|nr:MULTISPECIES: carbonic anhydrase [Lascolabacillus]MBP6175886.1 carbonic anhydrase [Fermentimonas sp.]MDI9626083.1 carbonic anhydrase [Bacteroidota bacterium]TAH62567.1 MAG: carbonic anhydrase [Fermentimonas caenicola]MBP6196418.1 carbonic anhydrase [Fermentimonas sp.]MDD3658123.1 carbonic anhydrase [Lascolabacillus sp.]
MELHGKEKFNSLYYKRLFEGIREFKANEYIPRQQFFEELGKKQNPHTLFIGCSDSRVVPNLITQTFPGELFVVRNIANLVPHYKRHSDTYLATTSAIEFAVNQMNVSNIVVCGHSNCGGCAALYQDKELKNLPHTKKWMELAHPVKKIVEQKIAKNKITLEERTLFTEQLNVVEQMNHLLKYSYIKKRVKEGKLNVMGWYYHIDTGEIYNYDRNLKRFIRIE